MLLGVDLVGKTLCGDVWCAVGAREYDGRLLTMVLLLQTNMWCVRLLSNVLVLQRNEVDKRSCIFIC